MRNALEVEDLFAEVLRKTGASFGRKALMEFIGRSAKVGCSCQLDSLDNVSAGPQLPN
jgi:hypothetical protein